MLAAGALSCIEATVRLREPPSRLRVRSKRGLGLS
jgi:hypothetical protein